MAACDHHYQQHTHCTDEVVEAQRDEVTCLGFFFFFGNTYLWLCGVFIATHSNNVTSGGYSLVAVCRLFLLWWLPLWGTSSRTRRLQQLWLTDSVTLLHVGTSRTRD